MTEPVIFACDAAPGCRYAAVIGSTSFEASMRNAKRLAERLSGSRYALLAMDYRGAEPSLTFIRVGDDSASRVYVGMKERTAAKLDDLGGGPRPLRDVAHPDDLVVENRDGGCVGEFVIHGEDVVTHKYSVGGQSGR